MKINAKRTAKPSRLLVIRTSALGDIAMVYPVLKALVSAYPDVEVNLLCPARWEPIFSDIKQLTLLHFDKKKHGDWKGLLFLTFRLRWKGFQIVVDLHNVLRSEYINRGLQLMGLKGYTLDKGRKEKAALTRAENKELTPLKSMHQRYADVFTKAGLEFDLHAAEHAPKRAVPEMIQEQIGKEEMPWVGFAPFAAHQGKRYPLEMSRQLVERLDKNGKCKILLFGGGTEEADILKEWEGVSTSGRVINLAECLSFADELAVISQLSLMISMDSGNGHLAANFGVPVLTLWGVTHPYLGYAPFKQSEEYQLLCDLEAYPLIPTSVYGKKVPEGYEKAMESITVEKVFRRVLKLLREQGDLTD